MLLINKVSCLYFLKMKNKTKNCVFKGTEVSYRNQAAQYIDRLWALASYNIYRAPAPTPAHPCRSGTELGRCLSSCSIDGSKVTKDQTLCLIRTTRTRCANVLSLCVWAQFDPLFLCWENCLCRRRMGWSSLAVSHISGTYSEEGK